MKYGCLVRKVSDLKCGVLLSARIYWPHQYADFPNLVFTPQLGYKNIRIIIRNIRIASVYLYSVDREAKINNSPWDSVQDNPRFGYAHGRSRCHCLLLLFTTVAACNILPTEQFI